MRIGFVSTYPPIECGIATYTQYLTDALRAKQTDIYVVSHIGGTGQQVFPAFDYEDGDLGEKAFSTMVRFTPDIVHIQHEFGLYGKHLGVSVVPLILEFKMLGIPVVSTLHTVYTDMDAAHRTILEAVITNSDRVIVHEPYQLDTLKGMI
ncbi:MAG: glycosyl transferase, partial [Deltaproteobacteria bacterium]